MSQLKHSIWKRLIASFANTNAESKFGPVKKTLVEGIRGTWHYHLSDDGKTALCGAWVMPTGVREDTWGYVGHLNERYCKKCEDIRNEKI